MIRRMRLLFSLLLLSTFSLCPVLAESAFFPEFSSPEEVDRSVEYPADSGIIDVTKAPYFARGDGRTDDTAAIQQAIRDALNYRSGSRIVYFPAGTYLLSDTLSWQNEEGKWFNYVSLQGASRKTAILRLADQAKGFDDPSQPKAVIRTGSLGRWKQNGNAGFSNYMADLTISTGSGNPGAIGIDYLGNNDTALRNLRIGSTDRKGVAGLASIRSNGGPYLAKNIEIIGFDFGVRVGFSWYSHIFEYLVLRDQQRAGIHVLPERGLNPQGPLLTLRRVSHHAPVPLLQQQDPSSVVSIVEAYASQAPAGGAPLLKSDGFLYARDVASAEAVRLTATSEEASTQTSVFNSHPIPGFEDSEPLALPVRETPFDDPGTTAEWVSVAQFGADPGDNENDAPAIQAALNSGARVIYFPVGKKTNDYYRIEDTLQIPAQVTHLIGMNMRVKPPKGHPDFYGEQPKAVFAVSEESEKPLYIERMKIDEFWHFGKIESIHHTANRPLVLRELIFENYWAGPNAGELFMESVACARVTLPPRNTTWARHLNPETIGDKIVNNGGDFWVLGLKSEQASTLLRTTAGGRSEVLGTVQTASPPIPDDVPVFVVEDGSMAFNLITRTNSKRQKFETLVEHVGGTNLRRTDVPGRPYNPYDAVVTRARVGDDGGPEKPETLVYWNSFEDHPVLLRSGSLDEALTVKLYHGENELVRAEAKDEPLSLFASIMRFIFGDSDDSASLDPSSEHFEITFPPKTDRVDVVPPQATGSGLSYTSILNEGLAGWPHTLAQWTDSGDQRLPFEDKDLVLALSAARGLRLDSELGVSRWEDQTSYNHRVDSVTSARRPTLDPGEVPALRFADDKLEIHIAEALHGKTLTGRTWVFRIQADTGREQRQTLYHEGAGSRGVAAYIDGGAFHFTGWNLPKDGLNTPWEDAHIHAPLPADGSMTTVTVVLDGIEPSLKLYFDGVLVSETDTAGIFGRHVGGRSFLGVQHQNVPFPGEPKEKSTPVEGRGGNPFYGSLSDLLIYNQALTQEAVASLSKVLPLK